MTKPKDLWGTYTQNLCCKTCFYYVQKTADIGRCRRHAPTMKGFPVVFPNDWCGDHKLVRLLSTSNETEETNNA